MNKLKDFQIIGRDFLIKKKKALLADEMRLGKTVQVIEAIKVIEPKKVLVICPAVACIVWEDESVEWELDMYLVEPQDALTHRSKEGFVTVVSYEMASKHKKILTAIEWDLLIIDEGHFLKTPTSLRTKTVYGPKGIARHTKRIWILTGTPAPNNVSELWTMLSVFGYTSMGHDDFINYYCNVNYVTGKILGTQKKRIPELRKILKKFMLRRKKKDVAPELPFAVVERRPIKADLKMVDYLLPMESKELIREADLETAKLLNKLKTFKTDRGKLNHLEENVLEYATLRRITGILKVGAVFKLIEHEIKHKLTNKLVVFAYHTQVIEALLFLLKEAKIPAVSIYGKTTNVQKRKALETFKKTGRNCTQVIVCQIQSAGTAIDLSVASEGIMVERDWVPGNNLQAFERMGGFKQKEDTIRIRDIVITGSVDDYIFKTLERKTNELIEVLDK